MKTRDFRKIIRALRKNFPVSASVEVKRLPMRGKLGRTRLWKKYYRILINSSQSDETQYDTILHEWAHVCAIDRAHSHDAAWGVIYADIYDTVVEQLNITIEG